MKKIHYCLSFLIILCITTCSLSTLVFADGHSASGHQVWDGTPPYKQPYSTISLSVEPAAAVNAGYASPINILSNSYSCYFKSFYYPFPTIAPDRQMWSVDYITFNIGSAPIVTQTNFTQSVSTHFAYNYNGTSYDIYYSVWSTNFQNNVEGTFDGEKKNIHYDMNFNGYELNDHIGSQQNREAVCKYFLFGVGDLNYVEPEPEPEEIEDGNLDIHGLVASVSNSQYVEDSNTVGSAWKNFCNSLFALLPDAVSDIIGTPNFTSSLGTVKTTVPGVQMIWDSPDVSTIANYNDPDAIQYTIWVDGRSSINIPYNHYNYIDTVNFSKLQLRSGPIVFNPSLTCYYNTNTNYQVLLDYFLSQVNLSQSAQSQIEGKAVFNTLFSRVYIQASKTDENGDIHRGAVSYVDFSSGYPVVHEGVTQSIDDIESSDSEDGTDNTVTQDYTVSGNTIVYGDTFTNNNITNNYTGGGLIIPDGSSFLTAGLQLINAILELIKLLFASLLVPFLTLGWTGHF